MTRRNVGLVFAKEIRDTLRDRRTLFISVILPILLYPLLMIGLSQVMMAASRSIWQEAQKVAVTGATDGAAEEIKEGLRAGEAKITIVETEDPGGDLESGELDAWVEVPPDLPAVLEAREQAAISVHYDSTDDESKAAEKKVRQFFRAYSTEVLRERWKVSEEEEAGIRRKIEPVKLEVDDQASSEERGAKQFGPTLALLLVVMAVSGAFYPAVDIMAGEKERGTMETLLVCPATRTEIVVGKYLTVFTMTMVTALLNFASMAITFVHFAGLMPKGGGGFALDISPLIALVIVIALVPLAGLFSAVALALSTFARSYKEGQHYLTPLFLVVMPLAMVALIPGTELSRFAMVPVAGVVLLVRDLMLGTAGASQILIVLGSTAVYAAFAIWLSVRMFNKEEILFRDPGGTKFTLFQRARGKGGVPTPAQALALAAACLVLIYFLLPVVQSRLGNARATFLFQFVALIMGLPVLAVLAYRLDLRKTLSLNQPHPLAWPAALAGAPAMLLVVMGIVKLTGGVDEESLAPLAKEMERIVGEIGILLFILVPPIAEEVLFRGFLLSGFRNGIRTALALVLVAVLFAFFHQLPAKYLTTGILGLWLGYLVVATGSLYPAILAHLANNFLAFRMGDRDLPEWIIVPAILVVVGAVLALERVRRSRTLDLDSKPGEVAEPSGDRGDWG